MNDKLFIIYSIGMVQGGFLIVALLLLKGKRKISVNLLLFYLICINTLIVAEWLKSIYAIEQIPFTFRTGETIPLLIGPIILLYVMSVVKPDFQFTKKHGIHFIPFVLFLLLFLPFYLKSNEFKIEYIKALDNQAVPLELAFFSWFKGLHSLVYLIVSYLYVKKNPLGKKKNQQWYNARLLSRLIILQIMAIIAIYAIVVWEFINPAIQLESDKIAALIVTGSYFIFAFIIILFPETLLPQNIPTLHEQKYANSSLSQHEKVSISKNVRRVLTEEKLYLDPHLSLGELAAKLNINSNQLSQVINELLGQNFYQLINEYRIEEVKQNIHNSQKTLYGIALDSGFNSKSAFNRIFKEITGSTPSAYKKAHTKRS